MCTPACENGGTCINGTTNACMCPVGFTGDTCGNPSKTIYLQMCSICKYIAYIKHPMYIYACNIM